MADMETNTTLLNRALETPPIIELLMPTVVMMAIILSGVLYVWVSTSFVHWQGKNKGHFWDATRNGDQLDILPTDTKFLCDIGEPFYCDFDLEVLNSINGFQNKPKNVLKIALPSFLSLMMCATVLYLLDPIQRWLWPEYVGKAYGRPDINTALTCFLAPAGLIFALFFGFQFQNVLQKQQTVMAKLTHELSLLDQIVTLTAKLQLPSKQHMLSIIRAVKAETISIILQIRGSRAVMLGGHTKPPKDMQCEKNIHDKQISVYIIDYFMYQFLKFRESQIRWFFLELLGIFVFLGVLFLYANSSKMEVAMCEVTIFSISMMCYVVADLDDPFNGVFRVDLSVLPAVLKRARTMYDNIKVGDYSICYYPS
ncbi:unnamed protein product [Owenia fusiformis]|uniref:Uncharacterized protein n=1 Tax=Owenia fusiformis TaxID=6347 RepID=A0A8S4PVA4_OWEFU|nr:unnamed protein product [Owenia fusiformis]